MATLKRQLAMLLVLAMMLSMLPISAFAEADSALPETEELYEAEVYAPEGDEFENSPEPAAVRVVFNCNPAETIIWVASDTVDDYAPEEDGSFMLLPGHYYYMAYCGGYVGIEEELIIEEGSEDMTIDVVLRTEGEQENSAAFALNANVYDESIDYAEAAYPVVTDLEGEEYAENDAIVQNYVVEINDSDVERLSPEEAYEGYLYNLFYPSEMVSTYSLSAGESIHPTNLGMYNFMKEKLLKIAAGELSTTIFDTQFSFTVGADDAETANSILSHEFNMVYQALLYDLPYETFWAYGPRFTVNSRYIESTKTLYVDLFQIGIHVAPSHRIDPNDPFTLDLSCMNRARAAASTAQTIVNNYAAYNDYDKLLNYKDEVCSRADWRDDFSEDYQAGSLDYLSLINLFDDDATTKVSVRGYAEAFKYLCDLSDFSSDVTCYAIDGYSDGYNSSWNIVNINGVSYLADLPLSAYSDPSYQIFLKGGTGNAYSSYTVRNVQYIYSDDIKNIYGVGTDSILSLSQSDYVYAVAIDEINFPDYAFRSYIKNNFDSDGNSSLSPSEIDSVRSINFSYSNPKGIEYFTELTELKCYYCNLTSLDLSKNTKLTTLDCSGNNLTSLDLSKNTKLTTLNCDNNDLTSLDLSKNIELTNLKCGDNKLTSLDLSKNSKLQQLQCASNQLTVLDVSRNTSLKTLYCYYNSLESLNLGTNSVLTLLDCNGNQLTQLDVSACSALESLYSGYNQLTELDVSCNNALTNLGFSSNKLTSIDLSNHDPQMYVSSSGQTSSTEAKWSDGKLLVDMASVVGKDFIRSVFLSSNFSDTDNYDRTTGILTLAPDGSKEAVSVVYYFNHGYERVVLDGDLGTVMDVTLTVTVPDKPTGIAIDETNFPDVAFRTVVTGYDADGNGSLSEEEIAKVSSISCFNKGISSLKGIEHFPALEYLYCYNNNLSELDLSNNTALMTVNCSSNNIGNLKLYNNFKLSTLDCSYNNLSALDLSNTPSLTILACGNNNIHTLDLSNNPELTKLYCGRSKLSMLDLSNNPKLREGYCGEQVITVDGYEVNGIVYVDLKPIVGAENIGRVSVSDGASYDSSTGIVALISGSVGFGYSYNHGLSSYPPLRGSAYLRSGSCSESVTWTLSDNGTLTVFGNGTVNITNEYANAPWQAPNYPTNKIVFSTNSSMTLSGGISTAGVPLVFSGGTINLGFMLRLPDNSSLTVMSGTNMNILSTGQVILCGGTFNVENGVNVSFAYKDGGNILFNPWLYSRGSISEATNLALNSNEYAHVYTVDTAEELKKALSYSGNTHINLTGSVTVNYDIKLRANQQLNFDGKDIILTIPNGYSLTVAGRITTGDYAPSGEIKLNLNALRYEGNGRIQNTVKLTNISIPLDTPTITVSNDASTGKPKVSWNAVSGAESYEVWGRGGKTSSYTNLYTTSNTSFNHVDAEAGENYIYKVRAIRSNTGEKTAFSEAASITCDLKMPTISVSNTASSGKPVVSWGAISGAASYDVYARSGQSSAYTKLTNTSSTSYSHSSAVAGETYIYKVRAVHSNAAANSAFSGGKGIVCDLKIPTLSVSTNAASGKPVVSWSAVAGAASYDIYARDSQTSVYTKLTNTSSTSYNHSNAVAGETYIYKVRAVHSNPSANSAFSGGMGVVCDLKMPTISISNNAASGKPTVSWDKISGASSYDIYARSSKTSVYTKLGNTSAASFNHSDAVAGETYFYKVRAVHSKASANSAFTGGKGYICDLAMPTISVSRAADSGKPMVSWNVIPGAAGYEVYVRTSDTSVYTKLATAYGSSFIHSDAEKGEVYFYKVRAIHSNASANSVLSDGKGITSR